MYKIYFAIAYLIVVFACFVYCWYLALAKCTSLEHRLYVICSGISGMLLGVAACIVEFLDF